MLRFTKNQFKEKATLSIKSLEMTTKIRYKTKSFKISKF